MTLYPLRQASLTARKWFPMDKNYVLKAVQAEVQDEMLAWTSDYARSFYLQYFNPLGLVDDTVQQVRQAEFNRLSLLYPFYEKMAAIYRYRHGEVQLEMLFDGRSHDEKYRQEWQAAYKQWLTELFVKKLTLKAILAITVFEQHGEHQLRLLHQRLQSYIEQHFDLRLYVYRGIVAAGQVA